MRFKATISQRGIRVLERGFLPTFEKFGKSCQLLLSPVDAQFVQDTSESDGLQIITRISNDVLYEFNTCRCTSKHNDRIAFSFDIALLLKVLRSATNHHAETLDMKLALRTIPTAPGATATNEKRPVLAFSWKGNDISMNQDMPISKQFSDREVDALQELCDLPALCPFYVDILQEVPLLQAVVDKLKPLSSDVVLTATRQGDLHLSVSSGGVSLGEGIRGLDVRPAEAAEGAAELQAHSAEGRLREAEAAGDASSVSLLIKHLGKALHSSLLTGPELLLCGIAENKGYVHLVFAYRDPEAEGFDDSMSLSYKLPVLEE